MPDKRTCSDPEQHRRDVASRGAKRPSRQEQIEIATIRSLLRLTEGDPTEFADSSPPPRSIAQWLRRTDLRQVRGLLIDTLQHWHKLRGQQPPNS